MTVQFQNTAAAEESLTVEDYQAWQRLYKPKTSNSQQSQKSLCDGGQHDNSEASSEVRLENT